MVFGPYLCMFLAVMSTDSPDHSEYAPAIVGSVTAIFSYLLFLELPLQATRQWALHRTTLGARHFGNRLAVGAAVLQKADVLRHA